MKKVLRGGYLVTLRSGIKVIKRMINDKLSKESIIVAIGAFITFILFTKFDIFELLNTVCRKYEKYEIDEIILVLIIVSITFSYFSIKRWRKLKIVTNRLQQAVVRDKLTGLLNRRGVFSIAEKQFKIANIVEMPICIMFIDLNRFKKINDSLGHKVGDLVLQEVAKRLKANIRESDIAARLGGDEFLIMFPNMNEEESEKMALRITKFFSFPFLLDSNEISIGASIGISLYPNHSTNFEKLIQYSDIAMYNAKKRNLNYKIYNAKISNEFKREFLK
ncbi:GGDEF domain-containing protein [Clostridium ganghwense]|uniref:GGDEF domain-containing protein n=1 Tax=Clostridium ganghwense TaxID=312089 RepID=UPI00227C706F